MTIPYRCTATIDGVEVHAAAAEFQVAAEKDELGIPHIGCSKTQIGVWVDLHDAEAIPFSTLAHLFQLAHPVTREKIVEMKLEFWRDEDRDEAICSYSFDGWVSLFKTACPPHAADTPANHTLYLELEPDVDENIYKPIAISN